MTVHRSPRAAQNFRANGGGRRHRFARRRRPDPRTHRSQRRRQNHRAERNPRTHSCSGRTEGAGPQSMERNAMHLMRDVCFIADVAVLPRWMKVSQVLDYVAGIHPRFDRAKAKGFLTKTISIRNARVRELSKGMVTQLHLAMVMAIDARLLVLDEPTFGLDILYRKQFYDSLLNDYFDRTAQSSLPLIRSKRFRTF